MKLTTLRQKRNGYKYQEKLFYPAYKFEEADFIDAAYNRCTFQANTFTGMRFENVVFQRCSFQSAVAEFGIHHVTVTNCVWNDVTFRYCDLTKFLFIVTLPEPLTIKFVLHECKSDGFYRYNGAYEYTFDPQKTRVLRMRDIFNIGKFIPISKES